MSEHSPERWISTQAPVQMSWGQIAVSEETFAWSRLAPVDGYGSLGVMTEMPERPFPPIDVVLITPDEAKAQNPTGAVLVYGPPSLFDDRWFMRVAVDPLVRLDADTDMSQPVVDRVCPAVAGALEAFLSGYIEMRCMVTGDAPLPAEAMALYANAISMSIQGIFVRPQNAAKQ